MRIVPVNLIVVLCSMAIVACSSDDTGQSSSGGSSSSGSSSSGSSSSGSSGSPEQSSGSEPSDSDNDSGTNTTTKGAYGDACGLNSQCESGLCSGGRCTAYCSASQPCPDGDVCKTPPGNSAGGVCGTP